ncbi:MAG: hypothetical protein LBD15_01125 [Holosporales bacterium]|jgi:hypothetical protein|nr:hypothetical protein [Holosporales bacterium]
MNKYSIAFLMTFFLTDSVKGTPHLTLSEEQARQWTMIQQEKEDWHTFACERIHRAVRTPLGERTPEWHARQQILQDTENAKRDSWIKGQKALEEILAPEVMYHVSRSFGDTETPAQQRSCSMSYELSSRIIWSADPRG